MAQSIRIQERDLLDITMNKQPVEVGDLKPGDHIALQRVKYRVNYYHHGIYIGPEEGVIHYGASKSKKYSPVIQVISIAEFIDGKRLLRVNYRSGCIDPKATIAAARTWLEQPQRWGPYNIKTNNCEHFAMKCKTDRRTSEGVVKAYKHRLKRLRLNVADKLITSFLQHHNKTRP